MAGELDIVYCTDAEAWRAWLAANHASSRGVRLAIAKKGSGHSSLSYLDGVLGALCYGWIDGKRTRLDDDYFLQMFTPRGANSIWSQINQGRVAQLIEEGRMTPAGQTEIDRAKANGRWDAAYAPQSTIEVPEDLAAALAASPAASALFAELDGTNRFAILFRIGNVKRAETRAHKITDYIAMLERGETIYPRKR
jgi:uncharacterized protein YdeI (YjbR/CyaY-like superfamily)